MEEIKTSVLDSLTEEDIETLSKYDITDDIYESLLSLLNLIDVKNKDITLNLIDNIFIKKAENIDENYKYNYTSKLINK